MTGTNIDRFDETAAKILTVLYEHFPEPVGLNPNVIDVTVETPDRSNNGDFIYSEEWLELDRFIHWTAKWLAGEGYLAERMAGSYTLSAMGLKSLKHVAQPEIGSESLGEQIKKASSDGASAITSKLMDQFLSVGTAVLTKAMGID